VGAHQHVFVSGRQLGEAAAEVLTTRRAQRVRDLGDSRRDATLQPFAAGDGGRGLAFVAARVGERPQDFAGQVVGERRSFGERNGLTRALAALEIALGLEQVEARFKQA